MAIPYAPSSDGNSKALCATIARSASVWYVRNTRVLDSHTVQIHTSHTSHATYSLQSDGSSQADSPCTRPSHKSDSNRKVIIAACVLNMW